MTSVVVGAFAGSARASQLIDRNATGVTLAVDSKGEALVTYTTGGKLKHVLVWGAENALPPSASTPQVKFSFDYSGGYGKYHVDYWKTFANVCKPYTGPTLAYEVTACDAPDGSYWALQSWNVFWPDLGFTPWTPDQSSTELDISHWTGAVAQISAYADWVYGGRYHGLFGQVTYDGKPVFGYKSSSVGVALDTYGRLVYVDTVGAAAYGTGWRRENSFLTHKPTGIWCYGFYPHNPKTGGYTAPPGYSGGMRGPGVGTGYRISIIGPGVTPDVSVSIQDPGDFSASNATDLSTEAAMKKQLLGLGSDAACDAQA